MKRFDNKLKNNSAFTLVEVVLVTSIFAVLALAIASIYLSFSKNQARTKVSQQLLNDSQYALELMAREIKNDYIINLNLDATACTNIIKGDVEPENGYYDCILLEKEDGQVVAFASYDEFNCGDIMPRPLECGRVLAYLSLDCNADYSSCTWSDVRTHSYLLSPSLNRVEVGDLLFNVEPNTDPYSGLSNQQPRVTIMLRTHYLKYDEDNGFTKVREIEALEHTLQTTVSSRIYRR